MVNVYFAPLTEPTETIAEAFTRWDNDPLLVSLSHPNRTNEDVESYPTTTTADLAQHLNDEHIYLIYLDEHLVGSMKYRVDPALLFKQERGTAWISITIGEAEARGKGIGRQSLQYLEEQLFANGLTRIELGVFEFNTVARALYQRLGYREIGRIDDFTYWQGRKWQDIRMEKYLHAPVIQA